MALEWSQLASGKSTGCRSDAGDLDCRRNFSGAAADADFSLVSNCSTAGGQHVGVVAECLGGADVLNSFYVCGMADG